ncbi:M48 family metalloprotease [Pseudomonadota bacterium]|jgi:predicted Zn-dependent protease|nr:M48 family metalloprotease [Pseudomonadota bacterium]MDC0079471.1 M48 family metalloprotease [Pseudomonadota bacterium]|tara:strand:+ start:57 stop:1487 length:1431 start_codon:yes stop_codon:yes gene_type:complete
MLIQRSFFLLLFISLFIFSQEKDLNLPNLGDRVSGVISLEQERMLGQGFLEQVYAQAPLIDDPIIQEYTELLIYKLSETSQVKDRQFTIVLIDEKSLNAFAAPGGVIGVNGGLFLNAGNEAQLASVLGHELAHLSQRHFARNVLRGRDTNLASSLVMVSAIALAIISNNPTAFIAGPAALQQQQLRYSRIFEREADRYGFNNLIAAGYDPAGMGQMFENMAKVRKLAGDNPPEFLLTHPITSSRVSDAFNAADQIEFTGGKKNTINFEFIKGRLKARYNSLSPQAAVRYFEKLYKDIPTNENKYAYLSALQSNGQTDQALNAIDEILKKFPKNLLLNITKSEILLSGQRLIEAQKNIEQVLKISPSNYPASILKAKILSSKKEFIKSEEILRDLLISKNRDPGLWMQLSEVQRAGKNIVGYHLSRGEYYTLIGDFENALNQFQFALSLSGNSFQTSETIMTKIKFAKERLGKRRGF